MLKEEIKKRFEERVIKWLTLEAEVMNEVHKLAFAGEIDANEWDKYFISLVEKHGNEIMLIQLKAFLNIQNGLKDLLNIDIPKINFNNKIFKNKIKEIAIDTGLVSVKPERKIISFKEFAEGMAKECPQCHGNCEIMVKDKAIKDDSSEDIGNIPYPIVCPRCNGKGEI